MRGAVASARPSVTTDVVGIEQTREILKSKECKVLIFLGSDLLTRMLCTFCPPTIWAISLGFCGSLPESSADNTHIMGIKKIRPSKRLELYILLTVEVLHVSDDIPSDSGWEKKIVSKETT